MRAVITGRLQSCLVISKPSEFTAKSLLFLIAAASLQVSGDLVGGWTERVAMRRCLSPDGCLGASKGVLSCLTRI
jgi:hypothetical protein